MSKSDQSLETRSRLLEVSRDLFAEQGYEGTGVAEICEAAGVSKGAFYHHFQSKGTVLETIFQDWLASLEPALEQWRDEDRPVPDVLLSAAASARPVFAGSDRARRLLLELWSQTARDADLASVAREPYQRYQDELKTLLDRGVREGSLRRHDTGNAARILVSLAVGALLQSLLDRASSRLRIASSHPAGTLKGHPEKDSAETDWGRVVTDGVSMLLRGLAKES
jgi:AcrR family transcriptional regulator